MLTEERQMAILDIVNKKQSITVNELVEMLNSSESTIRRDLNYLDSQNKLQKVHGGAICLNQNEYNLEEYEVSVKYKINTDAKEKIAKYAASLIKEKDFVYIDAGTTTEYMIDYINEIGANYVTNGIIHARKLASKGCRVFLLGGRLKSSTEAIIGNEAVNNLSKYNFTLGFFGTNAISAENGYSTPDAEEAAIKEKAMSKSKNAYILADSEKFNKTSSVTFGEITKAVIITDKDNGQYKKYTKVIEVK